MNVLFAPQAKAQLLQALNYIRDDRPSAAESFRAKVGKSLSRLETFPQSGRIVPENPDPDIREIIISPYRFFYRNEGESVWIFAVWHESQIPGDI